MGTLFISRPTWNADGIRIYNILIDGAITETISSGQTVRIDLQPGHHDVVAAIDWCRSKPLEVEMDPEGDRHVRVGSFIRWWYVLIIPVIALTSPHLNPFLSWVILAVWCFAPEILFSRHYLNVKEVDASEVAARPVAFSLIQTRCRRFDCPRALSSSVKRRSARISTQAMNSS